MVGQKAEGCGSRVLNLNATDLPLLGLDYTSLPGGSEAEGVKARLTLEKSAPLYREALARLNWEFDAADQVLATGQENKARHALLSRQLTLLREIDAD